MRRQWAVNNAMSQTNERMRTLEWALGSIIDSTACFPADDVPRKDCDEVKLIVLAIQANVEILKDVINKNFGLLRNLTEIDG